MIASRDEDRPRGKPIDHRSTLSRYGLAVVGVAAATCVRHLLDPTLGDQFPFGVLSFSILLAAAYGGFGPGLVSLLAGTLVTAFFFLPPRGDFAVAALDNRVGTALYLGMGIGIAALGGRMRDARQRAEMSARTVRLQSEELQRQAEADVSSLASIVESSDDAIISKDLDGVVRSWNRGAERIFGYTAAEAVGRPLTFLFPPDRLDEEVTILDRVRCGGMVDHFESLRLTRDGRTIDVSLTVSPIQDRTGRVVGISKIARDITEAKRAEKSLRENAARFRQLADAMPQIVWTTGADGRVVEYWNERWYEFTGLPRVIGEHDTWMHIMHPDDVERCLETWYRSIREGSPYEIEYRLREHRTGEFRWQLGRALPVVEDGRVVRWFGTCTDIHEARIQADSLRESEARQRRAMDAARIAHWEWDLRSDRITYQDSLARLFGRPDDRPFADLADCLASVHPDDHAVIHAAADRSMALGVPYEVEHRVIWPDGSIHWLRSLGAVAFGEDGTPLRLAGVNIDITQRRDAEEQVRLLNENLEHQIRERTAELSQQVRLIDLARDAIVVRSREGVISSWNRGAERLYGWTRAEAAGRVSHELLKSRFPVPSAEIEDELERQGAWDGELIHEGRDGREIVVASRWVLDRDRSSDAAVLEINSDVTGRRSAELKLRDARDEAMAATTAKGEFLANMSHEIRTPMNGVIGMTDLLLGTPLDDLQLGYAETIRSSGEALLTVINDILDFSKIEAGKMTLESTDFDLRTLMEEVVDLLAPRAQHKGLEIACRVAPEVPGLLVGDPVRIRQVLTNLAGNAVKFTDCGEVRMEAYLLDEHDGLAKLRILVWDTGIGIPADRQDAVFESFTQVDGGSSRSHGGTGLGLAICRSLVALMGGRIGLESRPGEGSIFWFEVSLGTGQGEPDLSAAGLHCLRVLVVDDHETNRVILHEMLLSWGCRPETAGSGAEALVRLLEGPDVDPFGLILVDRQMPGMDGEQTARVIRAVPGYAEVPLVLLTSSCSPGEAGGVSAGLFAASTTKPVRRMDLYKTLCRALDAREAIPARSASAGRIGLPSGLGILLAEDNDVNRRVATGMLERLGCKVDAVRDGREAVEALDYDRHHIVLMDVQMPGMDGFAATSAIRTREESSGRRIPIIALTARAMQGDRERCIVAGMDGYISKPIRPGPLLETLRAWVVGGVPETPAERTHAEPELGSLSARALSDSCGDDPELTREVLGLMLKGAPARVERLEAAVGAADGPGISREAHGLKGMFSTVGAESLAAACQELETRADRGELASIGSFIGPVRDQWEGLEAEVIRHLTSLAPGP